MTRRAALQIAIIRARYWIAVAERLGGTMEEQKPTRLVEGWRSSWRWWSMRLNAVASVGVAYVVASPEVLLTTLNQVPYELRGYLPPFVGLGLFVIVALTRLHKQGPKK